MTALHYAAKYGHFAIVVMLCEYKADSNAEDVLGRTPLYYSIKNGYDNITEHLLIHYGTPTYELLKLTQNKKTIDMIKRALSVSYGFGGEGFISKARQWKDKMKAALLNNIS